nr:hypothetical protein [Candidatus Gracilibacteria bacterium]
MSNSLSYNSSIESDVYETQEAQRGFVGLPSGAQSSLRLEYQGLANKMNVERILGNNHPKAEPLYFWIMASDANKNWYVENNGRIRLVTDGIEINGCVLDLQDYNFGRKYHNKKEVEEIVNESGKELPNWDKVFEGFIYPVDIEGFASIVLGLDTGSAVGLSDYYGNGSRRLGGFGHVGGAYDGRIRLCKKF